MNLRIIQLKIHLKIKGSYAIRVLEISLLWQLLRETLIMLLEIYALLWKAVRETVLLLQYPIMEKRALLREAKYYYVKQYLQYLLLLRKRLNLRNLLPLVLKYSFRFLLKTLPQLIHLSMIWGGFHTRVKNVSKTRHVFK